MKMAREDRKSRRRNRDEEDEPKTTRRSRRSQSEDSGSSQRGKRSGGGNSKKVNTRLVTGKARSSYMFTNSLQKNEGKDGTEYKTASTRILIPKKDTETVEAIEEAIETAAQAKFGSSVNIHSKKFNYPLRDGDEELADGEVEGKEYKGHYFMNTKCYDRLPGLVDQDGVKVEDPEEREQMCVSGYYFRFSITFKAFDNESKGVRVELNNIMFLDEGDRLDNSMDPEDEFADYT